MDPIEDRTGLHAVLVTGAGSGVGEQLARMCVEHGYALACVDTSFTDVERVTRDLGGPSGWLIGLGCDVRDPEAVRRMVANVTEQFGQIDVVVNAAATTHEAAIDELTPEQWDAVFATNLRGAYLVSRAVFPLMKEAGSGRIVNIAPMAAVNGSGSAAYYGSVWGLLGFSRALEAEARPHGVRVTAVIPASVRKGLLERFTDGVVTLSEQEDSGDLLARQILAA